LGRGLTAFSHMATVFFAASREPVSWYCMYGIEMRGWNDDNRPSKAVDSHVLIGEVEMKSRKVLVFCRRNGESGTDSAQVHKFCRVSPCQTC